MLPDFQCLSLLAHIRRSCSNLSATLVKELLDVLAGDVTSIKLSNQTHPPSASSICLEPAAGQPALCRTWHLHPTVSSSSRTSPHQVLSKQAYAQCDASLLGQPPKLRPASPWPVTCQVVSTAAQYSTTCKLPAHTTVGNQAPVADQQVQQSARADGATAASTHVPSAEAPATSPQAATCHLHALPHAPAAGKHVDSNWKHTQHPSHQQLLKSIEASKVWCLQVINSPMSAPTTTPQLHTLIMQMKQHFKAAKSLLASNGSKPIEDGRAFSPAQDHPIAPPATPQNPDAPVDQPSHQSAPAAVSTTHLPSSQIPVPSAAHTQHAAQLLQATCSAMEQLNRVLVSAGQDHVTLVAAGKLARQLGHMAASALPTHMDPAWLQQHNHQLACVLAVMSSVQRHVKGAVPYQPIASAFGHWLWCTLPHLGPPVAVQLTWLYVTAFADLPLPILQRLVKLVGPWVHQLTVNESAWSEQAHLLAGPLLKAPASLLQHQHIPHTPADAPAMTHSPEAGDTAAPAVCDGTGNAGTMSQVKTAQSCSTSRVHSMPSIQPDVYQIDASKTMLGGTAHALLSLQLHVQSVIHKTVGTSSPPEEVSEVVTNRGSEANPDLSGCIEGLTEVLGARGGNCLTAKDLVVLLHTATQLQLPDSRLVKFLLHGVVEKSGDLDATSSMMTLRSLERMYKQGRTRRHAVQVLSSPAAATAALPHEALSVDTADSAPTDSTAPQSGTPPVDEASHNSAIRQQLGLHAEAAFQQLPSSFAPGAGSTAGDLSLDSIERSRAQPEPEAADIATAVDRLHSPADHLPHSTSSLTQQVLVSLLDGVTRDSRPGLLAQHLPQALQAINRIDAQLITSPQVYGRVSQAVHTAVQTGAQLHHLSGLSVALSLVTPPSTLHSTSRTDQQLSAAWSSLAAQLTNQLSKTGAAAPSSQPGMLAALPGHVGLLLNHLMNHCPTDTFLRTAGTALPAVQLMLRHIPSIPASDQASYNKQLGAEQPALAAGAHDEQGAVQGYSPAGGGRHQQVLVELHSRGINNQVKQLAGLLLPLLQARVQARKQASETGVTQVQASKQEPAIKALLGPGAAHVINSVAAKLVQLLHMPPAAMITSCPSMHTSAAAGHTQQLAGHLIPSGHSKHADSQSTSQSQIIDHSRQLHHVMHVSSAARLLLAVSELLAGADSSNQAPSKAQQRVQSSLAAAEPHANGRSSSSTTHSSRAAQQDGSYDDGTLPELAKALLVCLTQHLGQAVQGSAEHAPYVCVLKETVHAARLLAAHNKVYQATPISPASTQPHVEHVLEAAGQLLSNLKSAQLIWSVSNKCSLHPSREHVMHMMSVLQGLREQGCMPPPAPALALTVIPSQLLQQAGVSSQTTQAEAPADHQPDLSTDQQAADGEQGTSGSLQADTLASRAVTLTPVTNVFFMALRCLVPVTPSSSSFSLPSRGAHDNGDMREHTAPVMEDAHGTPSCDVAGVGDGPAADQDDQPLSHLPYRTCDSWATAMEAELMQHPPRAKNLARLIKHVIHLHDHVGTSRNTSGLQPLSKALVRVALAQDLGTNLSLMHVAQLLRVLRNLPALPDASDECWAPLYKALLHCLSHRTHELYLLPVKEVAAVLSQLAGADLATSPLITSVVEAVSWRVKDASPGALADLALALHTSAASPRQDTAAGTTRLAATLPTQQHNLKSTGTPERTPVQQDISPGGGAAQDRTLDWRNPMHSSHWARHHAEAGQALWMHALDDITHVLIQALWQLNMGHVVALVSMSSRLARSRRLLLLQELAARLTDQVHALSPSQVLGLFDALASAHMMDVKLHTLLAAHLERHAQAFTTGQVSQAILWCHAAGCTHHAVYSHLLSALRVLGALPPSDTPSHVPPRSRLQSVSSLLTSFSGFLHGPTKNAGHEQEQQQREQVADEVEAGGAKFGVQGTQATESGSADQLAGDVQAQPPSSLAAADVQQTSTGGLVVRPKGGISLAQRHAGAYAADASMQLSLWELQALYSVLKAVKHPEATAVQQEFVRQSILQKRPHEPSTEPAVLTLA